MLLEPPNFDTTPSWTEKYEQLSTQPSPIMSSLEAPPQLKLKPLLGKLEYSFLNDILSVIITSDQKDKLTIGWAIADLKGADLSVCMHYKTKAKPHRDMQRTLNLNMWKISKEPVGPNTMDETDDLLHNSSLTLKHIKDFTIDKVFQGNIRKYKPTIKGSSYFPK